MKGVCALGALTTCRIWNVAGSWIPPMDPCFHTSSILKSHCSASCFEVCLSVRWIQTKSSLTGACGKSGQCGDKQTPHCSFLNKGLWSLWRGYTEREVVEKMRLTNCCVCSADAPRQDILETCVDTASPLYHERAVRHQLFSQWALKKQVINARVCFLQH